MAFGTITLRNGGGRINLFKAFPMIAVHLACFAAFFLKFHWYYPIVCLSLYYVRMFFVTAGYHRYFSHRSFKTSRAFQFVMALIATTSTQKGVLWWAANHLGISAAACTPYWSALPTMTIVFLGSRVPARTRRGDPQQDTDGSERVDVVGGGRIVLGLRRKGHAGQMDDDVGRGRADHRVHVGGPAHVGGDHRADVPHGSPDRDERLWHRTETGEQDVVASLERRARPTGQQSRRRRSAERGTRSRSPVASSAVERPSVSRDRPRPSFRRAP